MNSAFLCGSHIIQMLPVGTVHIQLNLQQLDNITAVLFQEAELFPQDLAELKSCNAIVDMAFQLVED